MQVNPLRQHNLRGTLGQYAGFIYGGQPAAQSYQPAFNPSYSRSHGQPAVSASIFTMLQNLLQMLSALFTGNSNSGGSNSSGNNAGTAGNSSSNSGSTGSSTNDNSGNTSSNSYPPYNPPIPPYTPPTPPQPPVYEKPKVLGSAGLFGDPQFGVFTPNLGNIPSQLKGFESGIKNGQTVTLLKDADKGGLEIQGTGVQVDPNNATRTGIGSATFKSGNDTVVINGNGSLLVNGQAKGNLNDNGLIAPIQLASGLSISTSQEIDGANGQKAERFVISNGEYKITAAARKPHAEATPYLDMNFEELTKDAADNATGYQTSIPGVTGQFGIASLLRLEPGFAISA